MSAAGAQCPVCEEDFTPRRGGRAQVYCSPPCRDRADYLRNGTPEKRGSRNAYYGKKWRDDPAFRQRRLDSARWRHLRRKYGVTQERYEELLTAQEGRCAICRTDDPDDIGLEWNVDHCHTTGRVRGLLCRRCNGGLGWFKDNPEALRAAADYVERNR